VLSVLGEEGVSPTLPLHALREKIIASTRNREIIEVLLFIVEVLLKNSLAAAQMFFCHTQAARMNRMLRFPYLVKPVERGSWLIAFLCLKHHLP